MTSALASEAGIRVLHYRVTDRPALPDHDWLHSGLLLDIDLPMARLFRIWGRNMLRRFGIRTSSATGIFLTRTEETCDALRRAAASLALRVEELGLPEAARLAGAHVSPGKSFAVPDAIFDQRALTGIAQGCCIGGRVSIVDLARNESIALLPCDTAAGGFLVQTAQELAEGAITILADGAMIPALIEPLGIRRPLAVDRSPIVSVQNFPGLLAGLLVDLDKGISYVRHDSTGAASAVYTIAGSPAPSWLQGLRRPTDLPPFETLLESPRPKRQVAVAQFVDTVRVDGKPRGLPWIHQFRREGFPGLVVAVSNVANLALWTATQVMKLVTPARDDEWQRPASTGRTMRLSL
jgi:hypothetical protein